MDRHRPQDTKVLRLWQVAQRGNKVKIGDFLSGSSCQWWQFSCPSYYNKPLSGGETGTPYCYLGNLRFL
jgi:hypothetical protein